MRQIGTLASKQEAERFADFLTTKGVSTHAEEGNGEWSIWVKEEDHLETSRAELARFVKEPNHPDYANAAAEARQLRSEAQRRREQAARNMVEVRNTWNRPLVRRAPLTAALLGLCIIVALVSDTVFRPPPDPRDEAFREYKVFRALAFQDPVHLLEPGQAGRSDGLADIVGRGQIWRLLTPAFIHYGLGHIIFNLFVFHALGGPIETRQGSVRLAVLVLLTAIAGNVGEFAVTGSTMMGGMSGVCYGLFGYLWIRTVLSPQDGLGLRKETVIILMVWLVLGFTGILNRLLGVSIANWAHLFGMLMGMLIAWITVNIEQIVGPRKSA